MSVLWIRECIINSKFNFTVDYMIFDDIRFVINNLTSISKAVFITNLRGLLSTHTNTGASHTPSSPPRTICQEWSILAQAGSLIRLHPTSPSRLSFPPLLLFRRFSAWWLRTRTRNWTRGGSCWALSFRQVPLLPSWCRGQPQASGIDRCSWVCFWACLSRILQLWWHGRRLGFPCSWWNKLGRGVSCHLYRPKTDPNSCSTRNIFAPFGLCSTRRRSQPACPWTQRTCRLTFWRESRIRYFS